MSVKMTVQVAKNSLLLVLLLAVAISVAAGCAGEVQTGSCTDGEIIDEYICDRGEWVLYEGPCLGVDCGPDGACVEDDGEARCDCDSGFVEEQGQCVESGEGGDGDGGDACSGVDCGSNGSCVVSGGEASCECQAGFEPDGLTCVQEEPVEPGPCDDINCGTHGQCVDVGGVAECDCIDGYEEDNWLCVPEAVDPCEEFDCGPNGSCVESAGEGSCQCDSGFEDENDYCIDPTTPCDGVTCSGHGSCEVVGGAPQCNCNSGYQAEGLQCVEIPPQCVGASECAVYVLHEGSSSYQRFDYDETGLYSALDGPIVAAFHVEGTNRGYIFTETSYFRINTANFSVLLSGALGDIHSDLAGSSSSLQAAYIVPGDNGGTVTFIRNASNSNHGQARIWEYVHPAGTFNQLDNPEYHDWIEITWDQPGATGNIPPVNQNYRAMWLDLENQRDFADGSVAETCDDSQQPDNVEGLAYQAVMSHQSIHFAVFGSCTAFVNAENSTDPPAFLGFGNAPDFDDIGGAFWHNDALYLFTEGFYD